jgi:hypothetical protein
MAMLPEGAGPDDLQQLLQSLDPQVLQDIQRWAETAVDRVAASVLAVTARCLCLVSSQVTALPGGWVANSGALSTA